VTTNRIKELEALAVQDEELTTVVSTAVNGLFHRNICSMYFI
jgi:hypothetical protein